MKLLALLLLSATVANAAITPQRFIDIYSAVRNSKKISDKARTKAVNLHYVFVAGFLNEALPGYFADNIEGLTSLGISEANIHVLYPCSRESLAQNAKVLHDELTRIADESQGKLVIIAHSKGGLVALHQALANPQFVQSKIQSLFLIQSALGGSYVADFIRGDGKALDSQLPIAALVTLNLMKNAGQFVDPLIESSLTALTTKVANSELKQLYADYPKSISLVSQKLYYITSVDTAAKTSKILQATHAYLSTYYGANDGLVLLNHQSIPKFGTVLAHFKDADHADLTSPFPISQDYAMRRRALAKAIALTSLE